MSKKPDESYELLTVAELKELADQQGIEIPSDARKSDIIDALEAADKSEAGGSKGGTAKEGKNVYEHQMTSTETALISPDDFWRLKLAC